MHHGGGRVGKEERPGRQGKRGRRSPLPTRVLQGFATPRTMRSSLPLLSGITNRYRSPLSLFSLSLSLSLSLSMCIYIYISFFLSFFLCSPPFSRATRPFSFSHAALPRNLVLAGALGYARFFFSSSPSECFFAIVRFVCENTNAGIVGSFLPTDDDDHRRYRANARATSRHCASSERIIVTNFPLYSVRVCSPLE